MYRIIAILLIMLPQIQYAQNQPAADSSYICITQFEMRLYDLINQLRTNSNKSEIPLSYSLTKVAKLHTRDLETNHPDTSVCNYHSWSDKGDWEPCCYNSYSVKTDCIRNKPKELTAYAFPSYELITWDSKQAHPDSVFNLWNSFDVSRNMFLSEGEWKKLNWKAIGVSISDHYVSIWFGDKTDKEKAPGPCDTSANKTAGENIVQVNKSGQTEFLSATGEYHIIYGSYTRVEDAKKMQQQLSGIFPEAGIIKGENKYRISLDRFPALQQARKAKENYDSNYQSGWILKY